MSYFCLVTAGIACSTLIHKRHVLFSSAATSVIHCTVGGLGDTENDAPRLFQRLQ